jgi:carbamoyl-phosphate synthase large subunit
MKSILVTSIGAAGSQGLIKSLDRKQFRIIGCDCNELNGYDNSVDMFYKIPSPSDSSYFNEILKLVEKEQVNLVIPIMDAELICVLKNKNKFKKDVRVLASSIELINIFQDKQETHKFMVTHKLNVPKLYSYEKYAFPLIAKPRVGTGSRGILIMRNKHDTDFFLTDADVKSLFFQEYVEGVEISIDCFCDIASNPVAIVARERIDIRSGLCKKTQTFQDKVLIEEVRSFLSKIKMVGPCNIQAIKSKVDSKYYFFEVNCRFGGTYIASVHAGLDINQYILDFINGVPSNKLLVYKDILMVRHWEERYYDSVKH